MSLYPNNDCNRIKQTDIPKKRNGKNFNPVIGLTRVGFRYFFIFPAREKKE